MYYIKGRNEFRILDQHGFFTNEDVIARDLFNQGRYAYEDSVIKWVIANYANPEKDFIDIGAHIGVYAWSLSPHFKNTHAFEPNREVYNCLCANSYLKKQSNKINTYCNGISDRSEFLTYYVRCDDGGGNGFEVTKLDDDTQVGGTREERELFVATLDSYEFDNVGFIKVDVEGHEASVFKGAIETIKRCDYPPILFESWKPGMHHNLSVDYTIKLREELFSTVREMGYQIKPVLGWGELFLAVKE